MAASSALRMDASRPHELLSSDAWLLARHSHRQHYAHDNQRESSRPSHRGRELLEGDTQGDGAHRAAFDQAAQGDDPVSRRENADLAAMAWNASHADD